MKDLKVIAQLLFDWYQKDHRDLPWRADKNPYKIWLSEIMLQQTTVTAVKPYFERFIQAFPELKDLAQAPLENVLQHWSGLGYYSRARNIHKTSALLIQRGGFPQSFSELIQYPGIGEYTSRAISSIAFGEKVGVLDGNVIRVLSRVFNQKSQWWQSSERKKLQKTSDSLSQQGFHSSVINQALMELGATVCKPLNPKCHECSLRSVCLAEKYQTQADLPLKRPKSKTENWLWQPAIYIENGKVLMMKNSYLPFLQQQWLFPGKAEKITKKPSEFSFKHHITKYQIHVKLMLESEMNDLKNDLNLCSETKWVALDQVQKMNPSSLITKCFDKLF